MALLYELYYSDQQPAALQEQLIQYAADFNVRFPTPFRVQCVETLAHALRPSWLPQIRQLPVLAEIVQVPGRPKPRTQLYVGDEAMRRLQALQFGLPPPQPTTVPATAATAVSFQQESYPSQQQQGQEQQRKIGALHSPPQKSTTSGSSRLAVPATSARPRNRIHVGDLPMDDLAHYSKIRESDITQSAQRRMNTSRVGGDGFSSHSSSGSLDIQSVLQQRRGHRGGGSGWDAQQRHQSPFDGAGKLPENATWSRRNPLGGGSTRELKDVIRQSKASVAGAKAGGRSVSDLIRHDPRFS